MPTASGNKAGGPDGRAGPHSGQDRPGPEWSRIRFFSCNVSGMGRVKGDVQDRGQVSLVPEWPSEGTAVADRASSGRSVNSPKAADGFEAFMHTHAGELVRVARGLLRDPAAAEDVVQEVLVKVHRHWRAVTSSRSPDAYVRRMLVNECNSFWRRPARREHVILGDVGAYERAGGATPDAAAQVDDRHLLLALLRRLPARQRAVLVLRHYQGLPDAEIAAATRTSVQTVRSNASRGLSTLRRILAEAEES